jgi:hypothetical protein
MSMETFDTFPQSIEEVGLTMLRVCNSHSMKSKSPDPSVPAHTTQSYPGRSHPGCDTPMKGHIIPQFIAWVTSLLFLEPFFYLVAQASCMGRNVSRRCILPASSWAQTSTHGRNKYMMWSFCRMATLCSSLRAEMRRDVYTFSTLLV